MLFLYAQIHDVQGAFAEHSRIIHEISGTSGRYKVVEVRKSADLDDCDALIIPGGESTAMRIIATEASENGMLLPSPFVNPLR